MNLAGLRASATAHKGPLLAAGAGVAVLLGLRAHRKAGATVAPAGASIAGYAPAGSTGGAAYDSSSSDVYNALQPQIEQTQGMLSKIQDMLTGNATSSSSAGTPVPVAPTQGNTGTALHSYGPAPMPAPRRLPTPAPRHKGPAPMVYTVTRGDNLTAIGRRYGLSWEQIYNFGSNKATIGRNPNLIRPGQRLVIPR